MRRPPSSKAKALRVLLDEGVPVSVGKMFEKRGYAAIYHQDVLAPGSSDTTVVRHAILNEAVLVAIDNDLRRIKRRFGDGDPRYDGLNLIKLMCPEPHAAARIDQAITLIELEWQFACQKAARRLSIEVGQHFLRTHR